MSERPNIVIYHGDKPDDVIYKINRELLQLGVKIQNDDEPHDGFDVYYLERTVPSLQLQAEIENKKSRKDWEDNPNV